MKTLRQALFTGAGFSHNFGLYLASQMWEHIFNRPEIHRSQPLKFIFERCFNYEEIIEIVSRDHPAELTELFAGMNGVYGDMDSILRKNLNGLVAPEIHLFGLGQWLKSFSGSGDTRGYIFTLNHDLFFERFSNMHLRPNIPGVPLQAQCETVYKTDGIVPIRIDGPVQDNSSSNCDLIKLHGSCNWVDDKYSLTMIVGGGKRKSIEQSTLLSRYRDEFRRVLSEIRLLWIIGYGFSDEHVNECIAQAVQEHDLKLGIIQPSRPADFYKLLEQHAGIHAEFIKRGIRGYFPHTLSGIFQLNDNNSMPAIEMDRISQEYLSIAN